MGRFDADAEEGVSVFKARLIVSPRAWSVSAFVRIGRQIRDIAAHGPGPAEIIVPEVAILAAERTEQENP